MTREEFDTHYHHVFDESNIWKRIYEKRKPLAEMIVDIAAFISNKYDGEVAARPAYTPHDFKHHIVNVIKNADILLKNHIQEFNVENLFCFLFACILHDIGMIHYSVQNRFYHSYIGARLVYEEIASKDNAPNQIYKTIIDCAEQSKPNIDTKPIMDLQTEIQGVLNNFGNEFKNTYKQIISIMILGHSDLKFTNPINTLQEDLYTECDKEIHILAAFLRWADELDLSESRCQGISVEELPEDSKSFWDKLILVREVQIAPARITLRINPSTYNTNVGSYTLLKGIINKLNKERDYCETVFSKLGKPDYIFPKITIDSILPKNIQDSYKKGIESEKEQLNIQDEIRRSNINTLNIPRLQNNIKNCIDEQHLLKEGHYCLHFPHEEGSNDEYICIRNTLDCNGLLTKHKLLDDIAQALLLQIQKKENYNLDDHLLIGIANSGALIAAHMSAISGLPFAFWVPSNKCEQYTPPEKEEDFINDLPRKKIVLVIGVNNTGTAIADSCKIFRNYGNVVFMVGLINRDIGNETDTQRILKENNLDCYYLIDGDPNYQLDKCNYSSEATCPYGKKCRSQLNENIDNDKTTVVVNSHKQQPSEFLII